MLAYIYTTVGSSKQSSKIKNLIALLIFYWLSLFESNDECSYKIAWYQGKYFPLISLYKTESFKCSNVFISLNWKQNNWKLVQGSEQNIDTIFNIDNFFFEISKKFSKILTKFLTNIIWPIGFILVIWP